MPRGPQRFGVKRAQTKSAINRLSKPADVIVSADLTVLFLTPKLCHNFADRSAKPLPDGALPMQLFRLLAAALAALLLIGCNEEVETGLHISPAGHSFAFLPLPLAKTVSVQVVWPMPWALDDAQNPVVPHLAVKMMLFGGSVDMPAQTLQSKVSELGAEAYLAASGVTLRTAVNAPPAALDQAVALTNSLLRTPALPVELLPEVREAAAASRTEVYARASERAFLALRMIVMKDQPSYSESVSFADIGLINSVTLADVQNWHAQTVVSKGALIAVAGPVDVDAAGRAVDLLLAGLPDTAAPDTTILPMHMGPRRILLHVPAAKDALLAVIAPMPPTGDAGEMDDIIGSYLLGGDDQAMLAKSLTGQLGATGVFTAAIDAFSRKNRILVMSGQVKPDQIAVAEQAVITAYTRMATQPPDPTELARWTGKLATSLAAVENDAANRAGAMLESMLDGNNPMVILQLNAMLTKVTPESVQQRFATAYAPAADLIFVAISPDAAALPGACVILQPKDVLNCP